MHIECQKDDVLSRRIRVFSFVMNCQLIFELAMSNVSPSLTPSLTVLEIMLTISGYSEIRSVLLVVWLEVVDFFFFFVTRYKKRLIE